ncbi:MAG: hypothetical protein Q8K45_15485 [Rubrivivax sp.]|nr:hypothetical protein [Rubrivivax sp.]
MHSAPAAAAAHTSDDIATSPAALQAILRHIRLVVHQRLQEILAPAALRAARRPQR